MSTPPASPVVGERRADGRIAADEVPAVHSQTGVSEQLRPFTPRGIDFEEAAYLALRVGVAFLFIFHAPQKWLGWFGGPRWPVYSLRGLASLIEAVSSPLVALGVFTRAAATFAAIEMAGAYLTVHVHLLGRPGWPIENRGELAVLYLIVFAYMAVRGDGRYSLAGRRRAASADRQFPVAGSRSEVVSSLPAD